MLKLLFVTIRLKIDKQVQNTNRKLQNENHKSQIAKLKSQIRWARVLSSVIYIYDWSNYILLFAKLLFIGALTSYIS